MGVTAGTLSANLIGGPVADIYGWRTAFIVIGLAGVVVAAIFKLTVKEPPRGYSDPPGTVRPKKASFAAALKELSSKPTFWIMTAGATLASFCGYGITTFQTSFLIRTHGVSLTEATLLFNVPSAFAASVGVFMTGWLAEKVVKRHPNAIAWLPAAGLILCVPPYLIGFSAENKWIALAGICTGAGIKYGYIAAQYTIGQGVVGMRTRATATAILLFVVNLLGYGAGPPFIGYVSDIFFNMQASAEGFADIARASCKGAGLAALPEAAQAFCRAAEAKALQNSLLITSVLYALPAVFFLLCMRTLQKDLVAK
jgi:predicted MFS family arabinose efflux permease